MTANCDLERKKNNLKSQIVYSKEEQKKYRKYERKQ